MYQTIVEGPRSSLRLPRKPTQHQTLPPLAPTLAAPETKARFSIDAELATKAAAILLIGGAIAVGVALGLAGVV